MRRLFTSSSDVARRWAAWTVLTALLLAAAEGLLRAPSIQSRLPTRTHYYDAGVVIREDALTEALAAHGHVDVLFIGSSIVRTNIQPLTYDAVTMTGTSDRLVSFNAGLSGLWPASVALYLEHVWLRLAKPRFVVQGIRYAELAETTHALRSDQVFSGTVEAGWANTTWKKRLDAAATANLRILQYRGVLGNTLQQYVNGRLGPIATGNPELTIDPRGYTPSLRTVRDAGAGGAPLTVEPVAEEICARDRCRFGFDALSRAIAVTQRAGADYVLVNIPEHSARWGGREGRRRYLAYLAALREFARFKRVAFIDPTDGNPRLFDDSEYSDHCHMRPTGAKQLTSILARRIGLRAFPNSTGRRAATLRESARDLGEVGRTASNHDADTATLK